MENFVVSARKYRPTTFNSVVGQSHITETLKNAISRKQLAHAYLFTGPRGVGKTSCARIFAKAINCLNPTPDHEACGVCESCEAFAKERSFNIHELDAASNNSVDDMRALTEKVRIAPQIGKYSIYIIDEVHMLSTAAFNAFLKTLEEPPHYAIFILATTEKHKILPTILSRCQVYDFNRIRVEDTVRYLQYIASQENVNYDDESLHIIALKADGGMRDALSIFDRVVSFCGSVLNSAKVAECIGALDLNTYFAATQCALDENFERLLMIFDEILRRGFDGQMFISGLGEHLRNLLVARSEQTFSLLEVTGEMAERYKTQATAMDLNFLVNAINLLSSADVGYKGATNRRLHTELVLIKLCALKKKEPLAERYPMPQIVATRDSAPRTTQAHQQPTQSTRQIQSSTASNHNVTTVDNSKIPPRQAEAMAALSSSMYEPKSEYTSGIVNSASSLRESYGIKSSAEEPSHQPVKIGSNLGQGIAENTTTEQETPASRTSSASNNQSSPVGTTDSRQQYRTNTVGDNKHHALEQVADQPFATQTTDSRQFTAEVSTNPEYQPHSISPQQHNTEQYPTLNAPDQRQNIASTQQSRRSITGISINKNHSVAATSTEQSRIEESQASNRNESSPRTQLSPQQMQALVTERYSQLIALWHQKCRPRIASALEINQVEGNTIKIIVPDEVLADEINQAKWEIERDLSDICGIRCYITTEIKHVEATYRPVSLEQKFQYLVNLNPNLLKLHQKLDLTI